MTGEVTPYGVTNRWFKRKCWQLLELVSKNSINSRKKNVKDLEEIPAEIKDQLEVIPVKMIEQVLKLHWSISQFH